MVRAFQLKAPVLVGWSHCFFLGSRSPAVRVRNQARDKGMGITGWMELVFGPPFDKCEARIWPVLGHFHPLCHRIQYISEKCRRIE